MVKSVLRIDSSVRTKGSVSRDLADRVVARLAPDTVVTRDLTADLPLIDGTWVAANSTPVDQRSPEHTAALALSDTIVDEVKAADVLVISLPIYNFGVPARLKAWVDLVARAGVTFRYSETGPEGLLTGKRAILTVASGGTAVGSDIDFATTFMRTVLGFVGITDVQIIAADQLAIDADASLKSAHSQIETIAA